MQTFLPHPDFAASARCLDRQRLGKQRVEAWQILRALTDGGGWANHPAVKMWRGYEDCLRIYGYEMCVEWIRRGYRDTMLDRFAGPDEAPDPPWLGGRIHSTHRAALLYKMPSHYRQFQWKEMPVMDYHWPKS
jgi:hypothetical protein